MGTLSCLRVRAFLLFLLFFSSPGSARPRFSHPGVKPPFQAASCRSVVVPVAEFVTFDAVFERTAESAGIRNSNPREANFILCKYHHSASIVSDERDVRGFQACLDAHKRGKSWAVVASVGSPVWSLCFNSETNGISIRVITDLCVFGSVHRATLQLLTSLRCQTNLRHSCDVKVFPHSHASVNYLPKKLPLAFWDMFVFHLVGHFEIVVQP